MLTAYRSLSRHVRDGEPLPYLPELQDLYQYGFSPKMGEMLMIAGRSGSQKSGLALWLAERMNLPTLYFSGDMSAFTASCRLVQMHTGHNLKQVREQMATAEGALRYQEVLSPSKVTFSFGKPIKWQTVDEVLSAWVELYDSYPSLFVFDNLMDFAGGESDYAAQMENMQILDTLKAETGAAVFVLHHASDKSWDARTDPWAPPMRSEIKNGLSEKSDACLGVGLDPHSWVFSLAVLKQRMGPQDPTAQTRVRLRADPVHTRFYAMEG